MNGARGDGARDDRLKTTAIEARNIVVRYGDVTVVRGIDFTANAGEQLTLLGPSGCGKTTMLRAIAGLQQPSSGEIRIAGEPVYSDAHRINVPAERRGLSMVFQSYAIWPHMSVFENVAYGLRVRRKSAAEIKEGVERALDMVQMAVYARRRASELSGGQQQRVALARAFVFQPSVLLFDEPLSNLDAKLRGDMRLELRQLQHRLGLTSVYVTHDLEEALAMSDRIIVMRDGRIEQIGTPGEIYHRPRNAFVADFIGSSNLVTGRCRANLEADGLVVLETAAGHIVHATSLGRPTSDQSTVSIRTVHLGLHASRPQGEINIWPATVRNVVFQGDFTQTHVVWGETTLVIRSTVPPPVGNGEDVWISAAPQHCTLLEETPG
jgi:iron(III) transport system ATP-binding protein